MDDPDHTSPRSSGKRAGKSWQAGKSRQERQQARRERPSLNAAQLDELALAYAARFATSAAKLTTYLRGKLRERGWDGAEEPDLAALVGRMVAAGYVDDAAFAHARGAGLLRRGYGGRRVDETLRAAGIAEPLRRDASGGVAEGRRAALAMARKRGFGPFSRSGEGPPADPAQRQKQVAAMLRAGHPLASARELVNARTIESAEEWVNDGEDEE